MHDNIHNIYYNIHNIHDNAQTQNPYILKSKRFNKKLIFWQCKKKWWLWISLPLAFSVLNLTYWRSNSSTLYFQDFDFLGQGVTWPEFISKLRRWSGLAHQIIEAPDVMYPSNWNTSLNRNSVKYCCNRTMLYGVRGHSKSTFARNFQFLTPVSSCSFLFVLHIPPTLNVRPL